jgi:hypothetical protein
MTRRDALIELACRRSDLTRVICALRAPGRVDRPARGAAYPPPRRRRARAPR